RRVDAETIAMRAYVTTSDDAREARLRACYGLAPRRVASSRLAAHSRREGLCARTARRRRSRGRARMKADDACVVPQASWQLRWQRSVAAGGAMVPVVSTGTRETARAWTVAPLPPP